MNDESMFYGLGTDARKWAEAYSSCFGGDVRNLTTWFANAIGNARFVGRNEERVYSPVLSIKGLQDSSVARVKDFKSAAGDTVHGACDDWTLADWTAAVLGELGEFANMAKKVRRGDFLMSEMRHDMGLELADVACYLVILADRTGIDLESYVIQKFNAVSKRIDSRLFLAMYPEVSYTPSGQGAVGESDFSSGDES